MRHVLGSVVAFGVSLAALAMAQSQSPSQPAEGRSFGISDALAVADVGSPVLSPDGEWVVYTVSRHDLEEDSSYTNLYRVPFGGGESVPLTASSASSSSSRPRFSPDGRYLGFLSDRHEDENQVFVLDLRGGEPIRVTSLESGVSDFGWSPDGSKLVVVSRDPDPHAAKDDEDETKPPLVINRLQFKRDGRGYLDERRNHLYVVEVDLEEPEGEPRQLTEGPYDDGEPVWSPDGREIAFVSNRTDEPDANDNADVFLVPAEGGEPRRITTNEGADRAPAFSPDGRSIAYLSVLEPELIWYALDHLAVIPADGGTPRVLTGPLDRNVRRLAYSSDGEHLLFLLEDSGNQHLARMRADGTGELQRLVTGDVEIAALDAGPGGRVVFTASRPDLPTEVFAWTGGSGAGEPRRLTHTHDAVLAEVRLAPVETIRFESKDGTEVEGFVTRPVDFEPGRRYPTILWIHGGPVSQYATSFNEIWQVFAGAGYVVVSANPRGSSGYGKDFSKAIWADWGNKDFEDVMAAVDHVIEAGIADPARLGVGGWSYGGILTNYVITKTGRFAAAISGASETNYLACYGTDHYQHEWEKELGLPWENRDLYLKLSPLTYVQNVTTPTLVLCGEHDWNVPLNQSEQLYQSLKRRGVETTLIIYPGQSHGISKPSYQKDRYERYLTWFAVHLGGEKPTEN